jgi:hypothetical protein
MYIYSPSIGHLPDIRQQPYISRAPSDDNMWLWHAPRALLYTSSLATSRHDVGSTCGGARPTRFCYTFDKLHTIKPLNMFSMFRALNRYVSTAPYKIKLIASIPLFGMACLNMRVARASVDEGGCWFVNTKFKYENISNWIVSLVGSDAFCFLKYFVNIMWSCWEAMVATVGYDDAEASNGCTYQQPRMRILH